MAETAKDSTTTPDVLNPSLFDGALKILPKIKEKNAEGKEVILTEPFLLGCKEVLPVVEVFGTALSIVKSDIGGNVERLEKARATDPEKFKELYSFVHDEIKAGTATGKYSNTQALLWLTRAMDFLFALLKNLELNKTITVKEATDAAYNATLSPFHGWLARSAFMVAMQFCPSRETFYAKLGAGYFPHELMLVLEKFEPILEENHKFLDSVGFDKLMAI